MKMSLIYRCLYMFLLITGASTFLSPVGNVNKRPIFSTARANDYNLLDASSRTTLWMTKDDDIRNNNTTWMWRQDYLPELPYPLNKYRKRFFQKLRYYYQNGKIVHIYILGTCHGWNQSTADVELLLEAVKPDITMVEICPDRFNALLLQDMHNETENTDGKQSNKMQSAKRPPETSSSSMGRSRLERAVINYIQRNVDEIDEELNSIPGGEVVAAYKCWKKQFGNSTSSWNKSGVPSSFVLGDRPFEITWSRAWEKLRKRDILWTLAPSKTSVFLLGGLSSLLLFPGIVGLGLFGVAAPFVFAWLLTTPEEEELQNELESLLFEAEDDDVDGDHKAVLWLEEHKFPFPAVEDVLIRERDIYLACKLWLACNSLPLRNLSDSEPETFSAVAIVGAAHVKGMTEAVNKQFLIEESVTKQLLPLLQTNRLNCSEEELISEAEGFNRVIDYQPVESKSTST